MGRRKPPRQVSFRSADFNGTSRRPVTGGHPCARGEWCAAGTRELGEDGRTRLVPARTYQLFCRTDRQLITECLQRFPALYVRLAMHAGDFLTAEVDIRVPFGPTVLLRVDIDGLMRHLVDVACSWHERVAAVAPLTAPDTQAVRARELGTKPGALLPDACDRLAEHLDALLALEAAPMVRPQVSWLESVVPDAVIDGWWRDTVTLELSGRHAGNEILRLDYLGRAALLETDPAPERLLGVPCRNNRCGRRELRRAPPPQHDGDKVWYSRCAWCRDLMTRDEYDDWTVYLRRFYAHRITPAMAAAARVLSD
jgi:hypothetical protein